jgi:hypothetical protein
LARIASSNLQSRRRQQQIRENRSYRGAEVLPSVWLRCRNQNVVFGESRAGKLSNTLKGFG